MRMTSYKTWAMVMAVVLVFVVGSALLVSATGPAFTIHDKAYYADTNLVNFVRPGLVIKITSASIADDGTIKATFKLTDPKGLPLDRLGVTTPGNVSISLIAAYIPASRTQYVAYTTRTQGPSPITGQTAVQAAAENNGTFTQIADGEYEYTFRTKAPASIDRSATHTIGAYGNRNLTEFDLGIHRDDEVFNFVPNGSPVTKTRDVIKTVTCNKCHQDLSAHGTGGRKSVEVCILCHTPQTVDPDTGHSVDMVEMTHKIHMGSGLPSVQAGTPYQIVGVRQTVFDFSDVVFPADARRCTHCHEQDKGAAQQDAYLKPNRVACGACHDDVNFATGENHAGLPQISDNQCANCHTPDGEVEFDVSITRAHTVPTFSRDLPVTTFDILNVENAAPGQKPTITFSVKDKAGNPISPSAMTRLVLVISGPTSDYAAYVSEDVRTATANADGTATWTTAWTVPADAKGSFAVGIEGYRNFTLVPGTLKELVVRDAGVNVVKYFSVDGSEPEPRRTAVSVAKCNQCHSFLSLHGGNRNRTEQCVLCHNPMTTDVAVRPAAELPAQSIDFRMMVHKIHTGEELPYDYSIYGRGSTKHNYNEVVYPGFRNRCDGCHVNDAQQLPLSEKHLQPVDPRGYLNPVGPETAACTSCHASKYVASHALANTTALGESCATCHGPNADFAVNKVHAE